MDRLQGSGKQTLISLCESTGWNDKPEGHEGQDGRCTNFERKQHPTFRSEHTTVWRAMCESLLQMPKGRVPLRHVPPKPSPHFGGEFSERATLKLRSKRRSDSHWRGHNLGIAPDAKFDGDAGGVGEGATQAQAKRLYQCKKTEDTKDERLKSAKLCGKMPELEVEERTLPRDVWIENRNRHGVPKQNGTCEVAAALRSDRHEGHGLTNSWWQCSMSVLRVDGNA